VFEVGRDRVHHGLSVLPLTFCGYVQGLVAKLADMVPWGGVQHTLVLSVHIHGDVKGKLTCVRDQSESMKAHINDVVDMVRELLQASG
jgi:hypothetical protein